MDTYHVVATTGSKAPAM